MIELRFIAVVSRVKLYEGLLSTYNLHAAESVRSSWPLGRLVDKVVISCVLMRFDSEIYRNLIPSPSLHHQL